MNSRHNPHARAVVLIFTAAFLFALAGWTKKSSAQTATPVDLQADVKTPFRFIAYGDTRFHDPRDTDAGGKAVWTQPDSVKITAPAAAVAQNRWKVKASPRNSQP